jgi:hypothetical protein
MKDVISESLNIIPYEETQSEIVEVNPTTQHDDSEYVRNNFHSIIEKGKDALDEMMSIAKASEHPRAFEVVSTLMKTLVDANKDLANLSKDSKKKEESNPQTVNNSIFVGSTSELQQMLEKVRNG